MRHRDHRSVRSVHALAVLSVALLALLLPATVLATEESKAIDTDFSVSVDCDSVMLTAEGGEKEERETGSFAIYEDEDVVVEGEYDIGPGETLHFGPWTLADGSYTLVWDNEPGHDPSQSHRDASFEVSCERAQPTPKPTGKALPTTGVRPTRDPRTLPPTDTSMRTTEASAGAPVWPIAVGLGVLAGVVFLLTPKPARVRSRNRG